MKELPLVKTDVKGQRYGLWTIAGAGFHVRKQSPNRWRREYYVVVVCDCGQRDIKQISELQRRNPKTGQRSCGCSYNAISKHGGRSRISRTWARLYRIWSGMKNRCFNDGDEDYRRYGARGITVCNEWLNDFAAFREWSCSHGYAKGLSIDRIDNDGDYCPENCRWATQTQQSRNTRFNHPLTAFGETKLLCEWIEDKRCKVKYTTLWNRLKWKWDAEKALATPA